MTILMEMAVVAGLLLAGLTLLVITVALAFVVILLFFYFFDFLLD